MHGCTGEEAERMRSRVGCFVVCIVVSIVSVVIIATTVYPTWMKTPADAAGWGVIGSGLFLLATLIAGLGVVVNRHAPWPTAMVTLLALLLGVGIVWALLWTMAVGL
jgi:hypothetical protein